ncbi:SPOR domain-containing protein [Paracandidimonas soli]|uniref:DedD protein n=1 Tax=Paracandidimonas soli TaxID=1917182 RepID=A0A4R3VD54_9BURK|nr:SPOR domain-containing protein [Paracandidimonas soli]TCV01793.1 DedD protein [Paracandidimonas soli]
MGLFSRKDTSETKGSRTGTRPSVSSEAQARELRVRARRRLIGALALVLAAVIVVPMLFDPAIPEDEAATPVVVPSIVAPSPDATLMPETPLIAQSPSSGSVTDENAAQGEPSPPAPAAPAEPSAGTQPPRPAQEPARPETPPQQQPKPEAPAKEPQKPPRKPERTDDGSVALALLEGKNPSGAASAPAQQKGNFVLQIAAYTSDQDARTRRDRLREAGVTNAYVETAQAGGKTTHRLRVGPFPTREAAQAAQARLRALGYDNGFISSK